MAVKSVTSADLAALAAKAPTAAPEPAPADPEAKPPVSADAAPGTPEPAAVAPKAAPKNSVQDRIDELTREKKELDEFAQSEYEARLQAQRRIAELEAQTASKAPPKEQPKPRPDRTQYQDPVKYEDDLLAWHREESLRQFREEQAKAETERLAREQAEALEQKKLAAREKFPDFDEVIRDADRAQRIPDALQPILAAIAHESEHGVEILYHLAKNPAEAKRIFAMKPAAAALALGRIEEKYMAAPQATTTAAASTTAPVSRAPPPLPQLSNGASGATITDLSQPMSYKDYRRQRMAQIKQGRAH